MEDVSQVFNKVLGRNQDVGNVHFWENPERAGWLMKQGRPRLIHSFHRSLWKKIFLTRRRCAFVSAQARSLKLGGDAGSS